jgi:hypothetical protein
MEALDRLPLYLFISLQSFIIFFAACLGFALTQSVVVSAFLFVLYGLFEGIFRTVGKAFASDFVPQHLQRSPRIIARFGGDGLDYLKKRGSRGGARPELLCTGFLEAINAAGQLRCLGLGSVTVQNVGPAFFPCLNGFTSLQ